MAARNGKWKRSEMARIDSRESKLTRRAGWFRRPSTGRGRTDLEEISCIVCCPHPRCHPLAAPSPSHFIHTRDMSGLVMFLYHPTPYSTLAIPSSCSRRSRYSLVRLASHFLHSTSVQWALFPSRPPIPLSSFPSSTPHLSRLVSIGQDFMAFMRSGSHRGHALCMLLVVASGEIFKESKRSVLRIRR
jgi:hypothetical protein